MSGLRSTGRTGDHVAGLDRMLGAAEPQCAGPVEDDEQLLVDVVRMVGPGLLARRDDDEPAAELLQADERAELAELGGEVGAVAVVGEGDVGEV